jgi:hypothetical protein
VGRVNSLWSKGEEFAQWLAVVSRSQRAIDVLEDDARLIVVALVYEVILVIRASRP